MRGRGGRPGDKRISGGRNPPRSGPGDEQGLDPPPRVRVQVGEFLGSLMLIPSYYSPNQCSPHPAARCTTDLSTAAKATAAPAKQG